MNRTLVMCVMLISASVLFAQQPPGSAARKSFETQSQSTIKYYEEGPSKVVEITNVDYEIVGSNIPGRPKDERLVLRKRTKTKQVVDEIGIEATTTVEAWPLGVDPAEKPLYAVTTTGTDPEGINHDLIVISRGLDEIDWWSVYKLGNGEHLFDTYVPILQFSISRDFQALRYVGLEVPPDDVSDARLKAPNVVGVVTYASGERVIREALVTCDDPKLSQLLRSFADATRRISLSEGIINLSISQNYPSPPKTVTITVPIARDDLDIARTKAPAGLHVTAWKR
jgi:hypothetical protein